MEQRPDNSGAPEGSAAVGLTRLLLRHGRLILGLPLALAALVVLVGLVLPRTFTARGSLKPQASDNGLGRLAGLAAQFGVTAPLGQSSESPDFYADLIMSPTLLRKAVETTYHRAGSDSAGQDLVALYKVKDENRAVAVDKAAEKLSQHVGVSAETKTGVVEFSVQTKWPQVSLEVADRLLELINEFNRETRQSQARQERMFVEARLTQKKEELRQAEDEMAAWLRNNRTYREAPGLNFEHERLSRQLSERQKVYSTLVESYERASLDEVRSTPIVTIIERPELPVRPDRRKLLLKAALAYMLGLGAGLLVAILLESRRDLRETDPRTYAAMAREVEDFTGGVRQAWRTVRRREP